MAQLREAEETPFLPFVRMHQLNSDLHIAIIDEPLTEEDFEANYAGYLEGEYDDVVDDYPTAFHPGINRSKCDHPRHPVELQHLKKMGRDPKRTHCPVCKVRLALHTLNVLKEIYIWTQRHQRFPRKMVLSILRMWATWKKDLENKIHPLEILAQWEQEWHDQNPDDDNTYNSSGAALAIIEYAQDEREPPVVNPSGTGIGDEPSSLDRDSELSETEGSEKSGAEEGPSEVLPAAKGRKTTHADINSAISQSAQNPGASPSNEIPTSSFSDQNLLSDANSVTSQSDENPRASRTDEITTSSRLGQDLRSALRSGMKWTVKSKSVAFALESESPERASARPRHHFDRTAEEYVPGRYAPIADDYINTSFYRDP